MRFINRTLGFSLSFGLFCCASRIGEWGEDSEKDSTLALRVSRTGLRGVSSGVESSLASRGRVVLRMDFEEVIQSQLFEALTLGMEAYRSFLRKEAAKVCCHHS